MLGRTLGRYRLLEVLDLGEAERYLAVQDGLDRHVLVTLLGETASRDPASRERFLSESRLLARLGHPHLPTLYDAGSVDGRPYRVGEVPGEVLGERSRAEVLTLGEEVASALAYLHDRGLVHGAIGVSAIRTDRAGHAVLTGCPREGTATDADLRALGALLEDLLLRTSGEPERSGPLRDLLDACASPTPPPASEAHRQLRRLRRRVATRALTRPLPRPTRALRETSREVSRSDLGASPGATAPPLALAAGLAALTLAATLWWTGGAPPRLAEQAAEPGARGALLRWRTTRPTLSQVEYTLANGEIRSTRPLGPERDFELRLEGLPPGQRVHYRFLFLDDLREPPVATSARYTVVLPELLTVSDARAVSRRPRRATLRWETNLPADTRVRFGPSGGPFREIENPGLREALDHAVELHGLEPSTEYQARPLSGDVEGPWLRFRTTRERPVSRQGMLRELAEGYLGKLGRMTPDEKDKLERSLRGFLPSREGLTRERKAALLLREVAPATFHETRRWAEIWAVALGEAGPLPRMEGGRDLLEELRYLRNLHEVNPDRARARLQDCLERLGTLERTRGSQGGE